MADKPPAPPEALRRLLRRVAVRARVQRALGATTTAAFGSAALVALYLLAAGGGVTDGSAWAAFTVGALWLGMCLPVVAALYGLARPVSRLTCAGKVDSRCGFGGTMTSALEFASRSARGHSPFEQACVEQATRLSADVRPERVAPLRLPRGVMWLAPVALGIAALWQLGPRAHTRTRVAVSEPPQRVGQALHPDDLEAFAQSARRAASAADGGAAELQQQIADAQGLIEALTDSEIAPEAALIALAALQEALARASERELATLRAGLEDLGKRLNPARLTKPMVEPLRHAKADEAAKGLRALVQDMQRAPKAKRDALRAGVARELRRANSSRATSDAEKQQTRLARDIAALRKQQTQKQTAERERLLKQKQRRLEQLRRQAAHQAQARRQLETLRRKLAQAGNALGQGGSQAGQDGLADAQQELERIAQQQAGGQAARRLSQQLGQMRRLLRSAEGSSERQRAQQGASGRSDRRSGRGGQQRLKLGRFSQAARGEPDRRQGRDGTARRPRTSSKPSAGDRQPDALLLEKQRRLRKAGRAAPTFGIASDESGLGDDKPTLGKRATHLASSGDTSHVAGHASKGPSRREVIRQAGSGGFVGRSYQDLHTRYEKHAESVIERDRVPGGYRFFIRRYFQLIRPRQE